MLKNKFFKKCVSILFIVSILIFEQSCLSGQLVKNEIPHLQKQQDATMLIVDGKPFLILGGELGNSSASSLDYMKPVWPKLAQMNLNTILAPVYWELIEPQEGKFDFAMVDGLINGARRHNLRLVLLWFGSWKNSMSCYVPAWVSVSRGPDFKTDRLWKFFQPLIMKTARPMLVPSHRL
jgi:beta-galactosidase GanA